MMNEMNEFIENTASAYKMMNFISLSIYKDNPFFIRLPKIYYWEWSKYQYYHRNSETDLDETHLDETDLDQKKSA